MTRILEEATADGLYTMQAHGPETDGLLPTSTSTHIYIQWMYNFYEGRSSLNGIDPSL